VFSFDDLVPTLDVEEKVRAKDTCGKVVAGPSSTNFVQRGNPKPQNKRKKPQQNPVSAIKPYEGFGDVDHTIKDLMSL
jgi:hypothetical protein